MCLRARHALEPVSPAATKKRDLHVTADVRALHGAIVAKTLGLEPEVVRRDVINYDNTTAFDV